MKALTVQRLNNFEKDLESIEQKYEESGSFMNCRKCEKSDYNLNFFISLLVLSSTVITCHIQ
jgi:hypothetical protein